MKTLLWVRFLSISFVCSSLLCANQTQDHWKGDEYGKNSESQKASAEDFMQQVQFKGTESILDVGCGDGKITAAMATKVPSGTVVGVDISSSMIQAAKDAFSNQKNLNFYVEDAAKIDCDEQFDLITSFTVMQWVLEQATALECFEKALKPGGKLWIQMPTGLPQAMEKALAKTISNQRWENYFTKFSPPWRFYQPDEYQSLLVNAHFTAARLEVATKHERFPSRAIFHEFLKQWFPYLRPIPADQKDAFLAELLDDYLTILPVDEQGRVSFIIDRLEVEAIKSKAIDTMINEEKKLFLIFLKYIQPLERVDELVPAHVEFLKACYEQSKFIFSGPRIPRTGGVILANVESLDVVWALIKEDPFYIHQIAEFEVVEFKPWMYDSRFDYFIKS